ncbi:MAG: SDR family oxidoreductase, partial [Peptococcaceae bacterium]|nr:SDR family oxidoreductase [Peptococcaceae bacterium]
MSKPSVTTTKGIFDLAGQNAIVTGGNGGIGLGIAKCLAECGVNIAIFCRNMEKAESALIELNAIGGKHEAFSCDVTDLKNVREAVAAAYESYGNFEILVNNAGVARGKPFLDWDEELNDWYVVLNTDLNGIVHTTFEVGKRMRDAGKGGNIINITSNAGLMVNKGMNISAYSA